MRAKQEKLSRQARSMSGIVDENMEMADQVIVSASTEAAFFGLVRSAMAANLRPKAVFAVLMSPTEAAQMLQRKWRQVKLRRSQRDLNMDRQMHLIYEQNILEHRLSRRKMLFDFIQHLSYMLLFLVVIFMQFGTDVGKRYETVNAISEHLFNLKTTEQVEGGAGRGNFAMSLMDITSVDDFWDWTEYALAPTMVASGRVYLRTYNQVVGSLRLQATRVSDDSCEWKMTDAFGRFKLNESKNDVCYGEILTRKPYGPWYDPTRFASENDDTYVVDFGKDPKFAVRRLQELRENGFLSERTRTITLALTLYNNALPMLCFTNVIFKQQPTGAFDREVKVHAFSVQEYLVYSPVLQVAFEACFMLWTLAHMIGEITEARTFRDDEGYVDLNKYVTTGIDFYRGLDWIRFVFCFIGAALWISIVTSQERVFDLATTEFVDLRSVAALSRRYTTITCIVVLLDLFSLLQYSQINDKMALITKTIGACLYDILYFGALAMLMFFFFGLVGHLLYGPSVEEWASIVSSLHTAWQLMMGEYQISEIELAAHGAAEKLVLNLYFYSYMALMLLVLMNLLIAILMDGYSVVRQMSATSAEDVFTYNVGPMLPYVKRRLSDGISDGLYQTQLWLYQHKVAPEPKKPQIFWSDPFWKELLDIIVGDLKRHHLRFYVSTSTFLIEVCRITHCSQAEAARQLHAMFVDRRFREPTEMAKPFTEPDVRSMIREIVATAKAQDNRFRELIQVGVRGDTYLHALAIGGRIKIPRELKKPYIARSQEVQKIAKPDGVARASSCGVPTATPTQASEAQPPAKSPSHAVHEPAQKLRPAMAAFPPPTAPPIYEAHGDQLDSVVSRVFAHKAMGVLTDEEMHRLSIGIDMLVMAHEAKATTQGADGHSIFAAQYEGLSKNDQLAPPLDQAAPPSEEYRSGSTEILSTFEAYELAAFEKEALAPNGVPFPNGAPNGSPFPNGAPTGAPYSNGAPNSPTGAPYSNAAPTGAPYSNAAPTGAPYSNAAPTGAPYSSAAPTGAPYYAGAPHSPTGAPYSSAAPTGAPYSNAAPTGAPYSNAAPTGAPYSSAAPTGAPYYAGAPHSPTGAPYSSAAPTGAPYSNAAPTGAPCSNAEPTGAPYSNAAPTGAPHPNTGFAGAPYSNAAFAGASYPNAAAIGSPHPNAAPLGAPLPIAVAPPAPSAHAGPLVEWRAADAIQPLEHRGALEANTPVPHPSSAHAQPPVAFAPPPSLPSRDRITRPRRPAPSPAQPTLPRASSAPPRRMDEQ